MASGHTCSDCRFWLADPNIGGGYCRRYPPQVKVVESMLAVVPAPKNVVVSAGAPPSMPQQVLSAGQMQSHFPMMGADGYCGEHKPRLEGMN